MKLWGRGLAEVGAKRLHCGRRRLVYVGEGGWGEGSISSFHLVVFLGIYLVPSSGT